MTKGDIDKLGTRIGNSVKVSSEDLDKLQEFRQTYKSLYRMSLTTFLRSLVKLINNV